MITINESTNDSTVLFYYSNGHLGGMFRAYPEAADFEVVVDADLTAQDADKLLEEVFFSRDGVRS
jgi:hypothetical protein